ncbi:hypothetical protein GOC06_11215 [Sinorhizobium meliloti]|uniref:hypothetical protein n=1 Tax=Rhizobium meliloti TaxID=382 RepID=UPI000FD9CE8D|nr:hypothetical protein [Sinorhizobium meliloti]MDX0094262.1 hypothetical protein [Sinorhizobium meliloti]MDX0194043.1 hypothetical protein [Sinorhizobium meliloti]MDX1046889.1 hypothetical protein [Sinorhizobium medicae]RVI36651.1 hypothetical protein CN202_01700 [Sinorhizobium meliloti]
MYIPVWVLVVGYVTFCLFVAGKEREAGDGFAVSDTIKLLLLGAIVVGLIYAAPYILALWSLLGGWEVLGNYIVGGALFLGVAFSIKEAVWDKRKS